MTIWILTLFPNVFGEVLSSSILKRAQTKKLLEVKLVNIRDFAQDSYKTVDDKPYGGGRGMVLKVNVVVRALEAIKPKPYTILLSASGQKYNQKMAKFLSRKKNFAIICGHYEGVDARVEKFAQKVLAIGDFVLSGGEIAAMAIVDSVTRLIPGVIQRESLTSESFSEISNLLEYPQYTKPRQFRKLKVPPILVSGKHQEISDWRQKQALIRTQKMRPDLLKTS